MQHNKYNIKQKKMNLETLQKANTLKDIENFTNISLKDFKRELDLCEKIMSQGSEYNYVSKNEIGQEYKELVIQKAHIAIPLTEEVLNFLKTQVAVYENKLKQTEEKFNQL
jgi:hypothetical protein